MTSMVDTPKWLFTVGCFVILSITKAAAADWPDGYVVYENTQSPDERYGILVPSMEAWEKDETLAQTNYFADLKEHRLVGKIRAAEYFERQNHRALQVIWAEDSSWSVVEYDDRFGFSSISILEPKGGSFIQTDIGNQVDKALATVLKKKSHNPDSGGGDATTYFRLGADRKLRMRAVSTTDPKQISEKGGYYALFQGTFDVRSKKWVATDARSLNQDEYNDADTAFGDLDANLEGIAFATPENKAQWLDERMNEVYVVVRLILPPARFVTVKKEQLEWLEKRDATTSIEEKGKLIQTRIKSLQELVW